MNLLVDYARSPIVIDTRTPRFSWSVPFGGRGRRQSGYQILVATSTELLKSGQADLWDSGEVKSSQSVDIVYGGNALASDMDCWWTVRLWDESGTPTEYAKPQSFGTPLYEASDWSAEWIGMGPADEPTPDARIYQRGPVPEEIQAIEPDSRAPMLRKVFSLGKQVKRARVHVCGLGLFELHLNGKKVGSDVLSTPRTEFRQRQLYSTYDVTENLREGENALGLMLGSGWFNGQKRFWGWQYQWYGSPRAILQLDVEYEDGTTERIVSDDSWRGAFSPITFNCIYDGEEVDARLEQPGWNAPDFDDSSWQPVNRVPSPGGTLMPVPHEQEFITEEILPVSVKEPEPGVFVFDMGLNITGWVRMKVQGEAGQTVTLRFGEAQYDNGAINRSSNNAARQEDRYTLKGGGEETFEPRFTFHGFQFVELTGYPGRPDLDTLTGCFVRTAVEQTGTFSCGHDLIDKIHRCTLQSQLCNVQMGVPTDDTQRPERLGWGADAWATAHEALYNLWMPRVYRKYIGDFVSQQDDCGLLHMIAPQAGASEDLTWTSVVLMIPWWQYIHHGDTRILEETYPALQRYMDYLSKVGRKTIRPMSTQEILSTMLWDGTLENRLAPEEERGHLQISQWGDHLSNAEGYWSRSNMPLSIATAFYYLDLTIMVRIAETLGKADDAAEYRATADAVFDAFNERFYNPALGYYDTGTQAAQAWPLVFGLVPEEHRARLVAYFTRCFEREQKHLTTGYAGTKFAVEALDRIGRPDILWRLATSTEYPSWGHMLRLNRTTSCERWDGEGGSLNHAPLAAAIDEWFYWGLAGIRPDPAGPGFEKMIFQPYLPADLPWAKTSIETARGTVASDWEHDGTTATWTVTVPANSTATVIVPTTNAASLVESGSDPSQADGVLSVTAKETAVRLEVSSGIYTFQWSLQHGEQT